MKEGNIMANKFRDTNEAGIALIKRFEGLKYKAYKLEGEDYYTIGYGHSFDPSITADTVWTQEQCEKALREDLDKFEGYTSSAVTNIVPNDNQFGALVSYCYNRGLGKSDGSNGLRQLVKNSRTIHEYANNFLVYWGTAQRYKKGLLERRKAEQVLFLTGCLDTEVELPESNGLTAEQKANNIRTVQKWLNDTYADYIKSCKLCGNKLLTVDGKNGNKTRAALTIALQLFLNDLGANIKVDGQYGPSTSEAVSSYIKYVGLGNKTMASKIVQAILQIYGYNPQLFYPLFNQDCVDALKQCQNDKNLNDDGKAGVVFFATFLEQR
jgi:lysozyme